MIRMVIADIPSSNNKYQGQGSKKTAIQTYRQEKQLWRKYIWVMKNRMKNRGELRGTTLPLPSATVIMKYHFKDRQRRDPDNYSGKFILDGLKENGFIKDDSFREIEICPLGEFGNKTKQTEIILLEGRRLHTLIDQLIQKDLKAK